MQWTTENLPFFQRLQPAQREVLCRDLGYMRVDFGQTIVRQGDHGDTFYMIMTGAVEVSARGAGVLCTLSEGAGFGELALNEKSDGLRKATIVAIKRTELLTLDKRTFNGNLSRIYQVLFASGP